MSLPKKFIIYWQNLTLLEKIYAVKNWLNYILLIVILMAWIILSLK